MTEASLSRRLWIWPVLSAVALVLLGVGAAWLAGWPPPDLAPEAPAAVIASPGPVSRPDDSASAVAPAGPAAGMAPAPQAAAIASAALPPEPAHWHLADARVSGDARTPPLVRSVPPPAAAAWQLDSPSAYLAREAQEHRAVQQAFVEAADRELPALRRLLDQAREQGLSAEGIAKGEEKLRRIAEQRDAMRAALAAEPPP